MDIDWPELIAKAIDEEFSVKTILNVTFVKAHGLKPSLKVRCACSLAGRPHTQRRTEVADSGKPIWNDSCMIDGCVVGDFLELSLWSESPAELLGAAKLHYSEFHPHGCQRDVQLEAPSVKQAPTLTVKVEVLPVPVSTPPEQRAFVTFHGADGLRGEGPMKGLWCLCEILGKPDSRVQTRICSASASPQWNELHELDDYAAGDDLRLSVTCNQSSLLGSVVVPNSSFHGRGFAGTVELVRGEAKVGLLGISVDIGGPSPDPNRRIGGPEDRYSLAATMSMDYPTMHPDDETASAVTRRGSIEYGASAVRTEHDVQPESRQPVPFQLRSLDTNHVHRLYAFTAIGRSRTALDPKYDLVLRSPGINDVSRVHAVIKAWQGADARSWFARIYDDKNDRGHYYDEEGCRALVGGGTFVDGQPVETSSGVDITSGTVLRFGVNELWVLESAPLHQRLRTAELAWRQAQAAEDPETIRELLVPSYSCDAALKRCQDWLSIVRVVLESLQEPDEAPCADCIEVKDECGRPVSRHLASTLEQQEAYDVQKILQDVHMGTTLKLRLSSDPCLLAPVLGQFERVKADMAETHRSRQQFLV